MWANQSKLPRLPLPALEDTLTRYLAATKPLVSTAQHARTAQLVSTELEDGSLLSRLQGTLAAAEATRSEPSFVARAWDAMYLAGRWPLAVNSNPGVVNFADAFGENATTQVQRAARMVAVAAAFARRVEAGTLTTDGAFFGIASGVLEWMDRNSGEFRPVP